MKTLHMDTAQYVEGARGEPADRVEALRTADALVLVVADGAGNSSSGRVAAEGLVSGVREELARGFSENAPGQSWEAFLTRCDERIASAGHGGQTTAVIVCVAGGWIRGASVGDSEAWLQVGAETHTLTEAQHRKPLVGSGEAVPVAFEHRCEAGSVLVGTDGLFKYVARERILEALEAASVEPTIERLRGLPRLRSGALPDDLGLVLCRFSTRGGET